MSETLYVLSMGVLFGTIILVFTMRYVSAVLQARARLANDDAYRLLATKAVMTGSEQTTLLASIQESLTDVRTRLAAIEKILKEVE